MKRLIEFIKESLIAESENKSITFDFSGVDNSDDTLKSLGEYGDIVTVDDKKVTVKLTADNVANVEPVQDIIQQAVQTERSGSKSTNDEQYAQKIASLEKKLSELDAAIDELENPDTDDDKEKEKKKDDESDKKKEDEAE